MKFTEADLKRLQEMGTVEQERWIRGETNVSPLNALIARLEAAECVCAMLLSVEDMLKIPLVLGDDSRERAMRRLNEAYSEWRKVRGLPISRKSES